MSNKIQQSDGQFLSGLFFRVLPAQIFLLVLTGINNMVDGLVGTNFLGAKAMSTIGLYAPFQLIWVAAGTTLVVSSQVLCARYMGAGDLERTRGVYSLSITLALMLSVLATLLSFTLYAQIARLLGASPVALSNLSGYIMGRGIGLIPMVLGAQFVAFLSLEGQDRRNYLAIGTMLTANVALDLLFAAVIRMGIPGLGIATSLSQWLYMIVAGSFFLTPKASLKYSFKSIRWKEIFGMLKIGFPSAMVFFLTSIRSGLFYSDPTSEVYRLTAMALRFGAAVLILEAISAIFSNYFQSIGRTVIVNVMSVLEGIAAMLPFGLLLIPRMGVLGSMITIIAGYIIVALCGPVYAIIYWKRLPRSLSEWVTIPADFGAADDERFDASIHSLEDAAGIAEGVHNFCRGRGMEEKKAYCSALALEEMCLGIIKDRFGADKKKHTIEVRVVDKGEEVFMSIKDDCRPYNPKDREKFLNPQDDSPKSISIRLFMGIIKETEYQLTLGINVFTVTI